MAVVFLHLVDSVTSNDVRTCRERTLREDDERIGPVILHLFVEPLPQNLVRGRVMLILGYVLGADRVLYLTEDHLLVRLHIYAGYIADAVYLRCVGSDIAGREAYKRRRQFLGRSGFLSKEIFLDIIRHVRGRRLRRIQGQRLQRRARDRKDITSHPPSLRLSYQFL